jgi:benzoyl-CoA reductase subunit C
VRYVDVPQNYDPKVGGVFWRREIEAIREDLSRLAGRPITEENLRQSISLYNENRRAIRDLYEARSRKPWFFPISEMYLILRAGNILPVEEHTALLREYLTQAPREEERFEQDESRVILVGMFCEQPPLGLLATIERAGCLVVDDDLLLGLRWLKGDVPIDGDPMQNLTEAFLTQSVTTASRYLPEGHRGRWLVESVRRNYADGVIFCAPSFCDPALLEQPMLVAALDSETIPHTQFKYSEDTGQFAVIREQAGTFSDSIRLWSEA